MLLRKKNKKNKKVKEDVDEEEEEERINGAWASQAVLPPFGVSFGFFFFSIFFLAFCDDEFAAASISSLQTNPSREPFRFCFFLFETLISRTNEQLGKRALATDSVWYRVFTEFLLNP